MPKLRNLLADKKTGWTKLVMPYRHGNDARYVLDVVTGTATGITPACRRRRSVGFSHATRPACEVRRRSCTSPILSRTASRVSRF